MTLLMLFATDTHNDL